MSIQANHLFSASLVEAGFKELVNGILKEISSKNWLNSEVLYAWTDDVSERGQMKNMSYFQTSIGVIGIAEEENEITNLWFQSERMPKDAIENKTKLLIDAGAQLTEYLSGKRREFALPLAPVGTPFMSKVWEGLCTILYGQTRSYGEIARSIGSPGAARAVGMANNRNPISIIIPCHRVIGSNGRLVGYLGGLDLKERLLELERNNMRKTMD
jgi:methylated-DNA-[protein]-cysteine S-methyltransferase